MDAVGKLKDFLVSFFVRMACAGLVLSNRTLNALYQQMNSCSFVGGMIPFKELCAVWDLESSFLQQEVLVIFGEC